MCPLCSVPIAQRYAQPYSLGLCVEAHSWHLTPQRKQKPKGGRRGVLCGYEGRGLQDCAYWKLARAAAELVG